MATRLRHTPALRPQGSDPHAPAAIVAGLTKHYPAPGGGTLQAVGGLSFTVRRGEVFALLGPNGAGKTTTLEILEGLTPATSGSAQVLGFDVGRDRTALKQRIGVQLQASSYFEHLTLEELLRLFGSFYDRRREPGDLLDRVGLTAKRGALVRELSGGQAQRFSLVAALVNDPDVVFLDEPTAGLDPQARRSLWDLVGSINEDEGTTVVLTTHYLEEAELLSDRVAIIDHGRLLALDAPQALIAGLAHQHQIRFRLPAPVDTDELAAALGAAVASQRVNGAASYVVAADRPQEAVAALFAWASDASHHLEDVRIDAPTLEDVFLARTGNRLRD